LGEAGSGGRVARGTPIRKGRGGGRMFARIPGKGITLEMYIRNTQVNKKNLKKFSWEEIQGQNVEQGLEKRSSETAHPLWGFIPYVATKPSYYC